MARKFTTAYQASENLYDLAVDRFSTWAVQVWWGYPGAETAAAELVWVSLPDSADQDAATLGQQSRDENYLLDLYIDVARNTQDPAEVNRRIAEVFREAESMVHDNRNLVPDMTPNFRAEVSDLETIVETQPLSGQSYGGVVRLRVGCWARI